MYVLSKNIKNMIFFSGEIFIFLQPKKSLCIAWASFHNGSSLINKNDHHYFFNKVNVCPLMAD